MPSAGSGSKKSARSTASSVERASAASSIEVAVSHFVSPVVADEQAADAPRDAGESERVRIEDIARLVYQLMLRDLAIERERGSRQRGI
jgi:hypothetical protein